MDFPTLSELKRLRQAERERIRKAMSGWVVEEKKAVYQTLTANPLGVAFVELEDTADYFMSLGFLVTYQPEGPIMGPERWSIQIPNEEEEGV